MFLQDYLTFLRSDIAGKENQRGNQHRHKHDLGVHRHGIARYWSARFQGAYILRRDVEAHFASFALGRFSNESDVPRIVTSSALPRSFSNSSRVELSLL